jgi:hypothetical protein
MNKIGPHEHLTTAKRHKWEIFTKDKKATTLQEAVDVGTLNACVQPNRSIF